MMDFSKTAGSSAGQNNKPDTFRKVLRIALVAWAVLFLVYLAPVLFRNFAPIVFSRLTMNLFIPPLYVDFCYGLLIPLGAMVILWATKALETSSRVVVLCAGALMILTALWYIIDQSWVRAIMAATYGGSFPLVIQILITFLHVLLMTLWALLFAGGLLLRKKERSRGGWIAGGAALLSWVWVMTFIFIFQSPFNSVFLALFLVAISTLCLAISLKQSK